MKKYTSNDNNIKNIDESFLEMLLQYHAPLVDHQFVNKILEEIDIAYKKRQCIIIGAAILGFLMTILLLPEYQIVFNLVYSLINIPHYVLVLFLLGVVSVCGWLLNDEF